MGTDVSSAIRSKIALCNAKAEGYLSSHVFDILFATIIVLTNCLLFLGVACNQFSRSRKTVEAENPTRIDFKWFMAIARRNGTILNLNFPLLVILAARKLIMAIPPI